MVEEFISEGYRIIAVTTPLCLEFAFQRFGLLHEKLYACSIPDEGTPADRYHSKIPRQPKTLLIIPTKPRPVTESRRICVAVREKNVNDNRLLNWVGLEPGAAGRPQYVGWPGSGCSVLMPDPEGPLGINIRDK